MDDFYKMLVAIYGPSAALDMMEKIDPEHYGKGKGKKVKIKRTLGGRR